ncbi:MAG: hypothetical protein LBH03_02285 [Holophagales bacterium]|jgi:3-deoxy-D-manno-octulosonic-acid transferase|nr:hypothetical protein [Holophagales bacterium]
MNLTDVIYLTAISFAASIGRAMSRGLPDSYRVRLEAQASPTLKPGWIWLHAVSVGELLLAAGLLDKLREVGHQIHITTGTQAGLELLKKRLSTWDNASGRVTGGGFPMDDPHGLESFFEVPPGAFITLETELWPNLFRELEARNIPRCVVNGRLTARTTDSKFVFWPRRAASRLSLAVARDPESVGRFRLLGAPNVVLGGNLKADLPPPSKLHDGWEMLKAGWQDAPILIAGNTVDGEEAMLLAAWKQAKESFPDLRMIVAPRQPKRFDLVANLLNAKKIVFKRASSAWSTDSEEFDGESHPHDSCSDDLPAVQSPQAQITIDQWRETQVLLLDTMGELPSVYSLGHIALVGGGWLWHGGHNPIEPLYWGVPTLIGPGSENFKDLVHPLLKAGCLQVVTTPDIANNLLRMLSQIDPNGQRQNQIRIPERFSGCLQRTWDFLMPYLPKL